MCSVFGVCNASGVAPRLTGVVVLAVAVALTAGGGAARADGDPASDVLFTSNVFFPYQRPSQQAAKDLTAIVSRVYTKHDRIKVALIASRLDLGAIPGLFGKPTQYAQFLGEELSNSYAGPLLIVMRAGLGIYDAGRSTAAEQRVLGGERPPGGSADDLAETATRVVRMLLAANALVSKDIRAPVAYPEGAVREGNSVRLQYLLLDDSGRASALLWLLEGRTRVVARFRIPLGRADTYTRRSVSWSPRHGLRLGGLTYCVSGADAAGNKSPPACGPLRLQ